MPFDTRLVAIKRLLGEYSVESQIIGHVSLQKLRSGERLTDVSTNPGYRDLAGVFTRAEILGADPDEKTSAWLTALDPLADWIMVVLEEWEKSRALTMVGRRVSKALDFARTERKRQLAENTWPSRFGAGACQRTGGWPDLAGIPRMACRPGG